MITNEIRKFYIDKQNETLEERMKCLAVHLIKTRNRVLYKKFVLKNHVVKQLLDIKIDEVMKNGNL